MTRRSQKKKSQPQINWQEILTSPQLQQVLAITVTAVGTITLLALFRVTEGTWSDAWVEFLHYWLGWGAYPAGVAILVAGFLWLRHQLDHPLTWRWRPFVGAELTLFSLLALTHTFVDQSNSWRLVGDRWGGGLVGWGISVVLTTYLGPPAAILILIVLSALGLGLTFDITIEDIKRLAGSVSGSSSGKVARRTARPTAAGTAEPPSARRRERRKRPKPARATASPGQPPLPPPITPSRQVRPAPVSPPATARSPHRAAPIPTPTQPKAAPVSEASYLQRQFAMPTIDLLNEPEGPALSDEEIREKSSTIKSTLKQFGLPVEVTEVRIGPTVTQFGVSPGVVESSGRKVRVSQISALADDLALALAAPRIRVEAPVPGRPVVGIEVPNSNIQLVGIREVMESEEFIKLDAPLAFTLGQNVAGEPVAADLARMPHMPIAGTTGSGKSICIKALTTCLIFNNSPKDLRLVMIDPKMVELIRFNGLPHLYGRVEVDLERVVKVLRWVASEMDGRYKHFAAVAARNIDDYNSLMKKKEEPTLPRIVVMIDELADLMMLAPDEVERTICRIAQMARATGIHLVVATQRPSTDVVTGLIKANFPARLSFATVSQIDSRVILDMPGAETLMGHGDMLFLAADAGYPVRVQGSFVAEEEAERLVKFWRAQVGPVEAEAPWERMIQGGEQDEDKAKANQDDLLEEAIALVQQSGSASASLLQRRLRIGHPRAARLMQIMEDMGVIGPPEAAGRTRRVIIGDRD